MPRRPWSREIYKTPELYDELCGDHRDDIRFYVDRAVASGGPVLDLACGTGRVTIPIAQAGIEVVGLDVSPLMMKRGMEKAETAGVSLQWVEGDYCNFSLERKFPLILIANHSIHAIEDYFSFCRFFESVEKHLTDSGLLIIGDLNPGSPGFDLHKVPKLSSDEVLSINRLEWSKGNREQKLSYLYPKEFVEIVEYNSFRVTEFFGDYDGGPFSPEKQHMILVCQKA